MSTKDEHASDSDSDDVGSAVVQEDELSFSGSAIFSKATTSVDSTVPSDIVEFM